MKKQQLYTVLSKITQAVSSPVRMEIVDLLSQREFGVEEIAKEIGQSVANTSSHLQVLKTAGLATARKHGNFVLYGIPDDKVLKLVAAVRDLGMNRIGGFDALLKTYQGERSKLESITLSELESNVLDEAILLLDVRPAAEYAAGHLPQAISIPLQELQHRMHELPSDKTIVAYCRGPFCVMAGDAVQLLQKNKFKALRMEEGFTEWKLKQSA